MKYLLGIDNGGTFSKAALFDEDGHQLASTGIATRLITPKPGFTERDMEELWQVNARAVRETVEKSGVSPADIAGISFSGHGKGLYLWGRDDRPVMNGILSTDSRAWEYPERWKQDGTAQRIYEKTCQTILACQPVSLLAWLRDHEPDVLEKTACIFSVKDYIRYRITGEAYAEYSDFSGGNLVNLKTGCYDLELLSCFGLEQVYDKLPPLKNASDVCGYVTEQAAQQMSLNPGTPVMAGMFDVNACGLASGLSDENQLCMIAGTWAINEFLSKKPILDPSVSLNSMFCIPGYFLVEESSPTSAGNLEWFLQNFYAAEKARCIASGTSVYDLLNAQVEEVGPEDSDLVFLPYLNGSAVNPVAKGAFLGMTGYHTKQHLLRAVYEGIVFSHAAHVQKLLKNRESPETIRLSGGAANSGVWVQIFADVLQIPIETIENKELGAQGAAIAAGIGAGIYRDYPDGIARTTRITGKVMPRPELKALYEAKFARYCALADVLDSSWRNWQK